MTSQKNLPGGTGIPPGKQSKTVNTHRYSIVAGEKNQDEFSNVRRYFTSKDEADKAGFYPRSYWAKQNREVFERKDTAIVVNKSWLTYRPEDNDIILAFSPVNEYLVTSSQFCQKTQRRHSWQVFCLEETAATAVNKSPAKQSKATEHPTAKLFPPPTSFPLDEETVINSDVNSSDDNELQREITQTHFLEVNKNRRGASFYFPEGFDWEKYPSLSPLRSSVILIFHKLHERRFANNNADGRVYEKWEHVPLHHDYMKALDWRFPQTIRLLLEYKILERDDYQIGTKSYGYRFSDEKLRGATRRRISLDDPKLEATLRKHKQKQITTRTDRYLWQHLQQLALSEIDEAFLQCIAKLSTEEHGGTIEAKLEAYRFCLNAIARQDHYFKSDDQGRRYTHVTNLKRELRQLLTVDGEKLQQFDIPNSQPLLLGLEMTRDGIDCQEYFDLCQQGQLYEHVAKRCNVSRTEVKQAITQRTLFAGNDDPAQRKRIKRMFDRMFPEVATYLRKRKVHGGSALAKSLQVLESDLIIGKICSRLRRENKAQFVTPVHDSLLFLPVDGPYVKSVMEAEFAKQGINLTLEPKDL